jgi:hydrogenase expression/formation protein HypE
VVIRGELLGMENREKILLAHGSGGKLMHSLIKEVFQKHFSNEILDELSDSAVIKLPPSPKGDSRLCFTTDSYVVKPLFFPGGDIGKLAICGTINDLAVVGAKPLYISCGFIIEEGLDWEVLEKITESMARVAAGERVKIVTGDVKVVERNSADKLFINTSGIGIRNEGVNLSQQAILPGDKIIINGTIGDHGLAVLAARGQFDFQTEIVSDCAPLSDLIASIIQGSKNIKFMRDPTRGGIATVLNEIVSGMDFGVEIFEKDIPLKEQVKALCEILGFDPLYVANEGKVVVVASGEDAELVLELMRQHPLGRESQIIGEVVETPKGKVIMRTKIGGTRIIDMLVSEQLPRIC